MAAPLSDISFLSVGAVIASAIRQSGIVGDKVGPVAFPSDTRLPYVCYRRVKTQGQAVKDAAGRYVSSVELRVWSDTYAEGISIAEELKALFDNTRIHSPETGLSITRSALADTWEALADSGEWEQGLIFTLTTNK